MRRSKAVTTEIGLGQRVSIERLLLALVIVTCMSLTGVTFAKNLFSITTQNHADVSKFNIQIQAPEDFATDNSGKVTFYSTASTVKKDYTFTVTNHSEVAVNCTPSFAGTSLPIYSMTDAAGALIPATGFNLGVGESKNVILTVKPISSAAHTVQDMTLSFLTNQLD